MVDIESYGSTKEYEIVTIDPNECLTIIHTSGSSGFPKGAMISESAYRSTFFPWCYPFHSESIHFCYEPLAWMSDRDAVFRAFFGGGRTAFSTGDNARLMEDLALVRPTIFGATPAVWNKIYAEFKTVFSLAAAQLPPEAIAEEEERLLQRFSKLIPTRCKTITVGGAMISPAVLKFVKRCFSHCRVYEAYGITECGGVAYDNVIIHDVQFRLISVPEMDYTIDDKPFPRGELLIKSKQMFSGYLNDLEETRAAFTEDGFFRTGDIVELRVGSDGRHHVHVIDRKKNFFKLSQGQYVSPEFLESIYIQSPFVEQIYVHGDLLANSIAAVVVPNREYAQTYVIEHNLKDFDMNNPNPQFYEAIRRDLLSIAKKESLRKHEIPSRLVVDFQFFTPENGLLTSTMKPCRHKLAAYYGERIKSSVTMKHRLKTIIETTTGQSLLTDEEDNVFIPTDGDSLTAVRLSRIIENDLGVSVPLTLLLQPSTTFEQLVNIIEDPSKISSMTHSIVPQLLNDSELHLDVTMCKHKSKTEHPSMIFVTGTTGFVGAFLLFELLSVYPSECKFLCLVRCESTTNPWDRIRQNMVFHQLWKEDFRERIIPVRGDLAKTCFGLDNQMYSLLAKQIDIIFHCGAIVNFVLPYSKLYSSNVFGTREIIRLATCTHNYIPIHYISTISVLSSGITREISIDNISPNDLVNGYAQSKWVAEKLIAKANRLGLPVVIYRLGSICASTETGACNRHDLPTLLFAAMMKTKSYPETIVNARLSAALPVNFTAKSIVYLSSIQTTIYGKVFHVVNPNTEIRFQDIIDSICCCGVQLENVSIEKWRNNLKTISNQNGPLESVAELIHENLFNDSFTVSAEQFYEHTSVLALPSLNNVYLMKWLNFILNNIIMTY